MIVVLQRTVGLHCFTVPPSFANSVQSKNSVIRNDLSLLHKMLCVLELWLKTSTVKVFQLRHVGLVPCWLYSFTSFTLG